MALQSIENLFPRLEGISPLLEPTSLDAEAEEDLNLYYQLPAQAQSGLPVNEEDQLETDSEIPPTLVSSEATRSGHNSLRDVHVLAQKVIFLPTFIEYPETSENGVLYVIDIRTLNEEDIKSPWRMIQYNHARQFPPKRTTSAFLQNAVCLRSTYTCTGGKACSYFDQNLPCWKHQKVTPEILQSIEALRTEVLQYDLKRKAVSWAQAQIKRFQQHTACRPFTERCSLEVVNTEYGYIPGTSQITARCICWSQSLQGENHYIGFPPIEFQLYLPLIKTILQGGSIEESSPTDSCYLFASNKRRITRCDANHIVPETILQITCSVKWNFWVPLDLEATPVILLTSHGVHLHPPPPPVRAPAGIISGLQQVVQKINQPRTGLNAFLQSRELQEFCDTYNSQTITSVHQSLANTDFLRSIIRKQEAISFPAGCSRLAIWYEYQYAQTRRQIRYIQYFNDDGNTYLCIVFHAEQAELWKKEAFNTFQVDTNYKHLAGKEEVEVIWGWYNSISSKAIPLIRVFTNSESTEMYQQMYTIVFKLLYKKFGYKVKWKHLHGRGLLGITVDQDHKNLIGFGKYLSLECDPEHRPWAWQVERSVRFCLIHFQRGIEAYCTEDRSPDSLWNQMRSLLFCRSSEDYFALCQAFETEPQIKAWAQHKARKTIAAGLNQNCSKIPLSDWSQFIPNTNTVEVLHEASYTWSNRYLPLLTCIQKCAEYDRHLLEQDTVFTTLGIRLSWKDVSIIGRYNTAASRLQLKRQRQRESREQLDNERVERLLSTRLFTSSPSRGTNSRSPSSIPNRSRSLSEAIRNRSPRLSHASSSGVIRSNTLQRTSISNLRNEIRQGQQDDFDLQKQSLELEEKRLELEARKLLVEKQKLELQEKELELAERRRRLGL
nr:uncharacterized protein CTRU02_15524 [Colletotrichum truncatum]XP_036577385.1 uncharacterized protein CTRU02_12618 [Colletotrichum truncatum]XP_036580232.1 uncharacterized protein CTRU02_09877 [Colletotrichum truncatum]XP_036586904.1 uncharacterized protein CTRU02_03492 [Colletotrichum truncatum]KAF6780942.1 hypothetical protein CTRU02_15524 [Colletotrichum truncatum]KAF6784356.1 hypothetical protein CTRU02_12618 [Colletotrichum truncatum]KAF6788064.1 hypothetical protein CTRU02_09877 [Col